MATTDVIDGGPVTVQVALGVAEPHESLTVKDVVSTGETTAPSATAGFGKWYVKSSDGLPYFKADDGTEYALFPTLLGSGAADKVAVWSAAATLAYDSLLHWDGVNDRLGVGRVPTSDQLEVEEGVSINGSSLATYVPLLVAQKDGGPSVIRAASYLSGSSFLDPVFSGQSARGSRASPSAVQSGDRLLLVAGDAYTGSSYKTAASIEVKADGAPASDKVPSRIELYTWDGSTASRTGRVAIDKDGNCGLGTTAPDTICHIKTSATHGKEAQAIEQGDADKSFTDYRGSTGADTTSTISTHGTPGTIQGWLQIEVNGTKRWVPFYDDPSA